MLTLLHTRVHSAMRDSQQRENPKERSHEGNPVPPPSSFTSMLYSTSVYCFSVVSSPCLLLHLLSSSASLCLQTVCSRSAFPSLWTGNEFNELFQRGTVRVFHLLETDSMCMDRHTRTHTHTYIHIDKHADTHIYTCTYTHTHRHI